MPLMQGKSKEAFSHNVGAERNAGKPMNQALAIAYNIKRKNAHKKMMSEGGRVPAVEENAEHAKGPEENYGMEDAHALADAVIEHMCGGGMAKGYAMGGEVESPSGEEEVNHLSESGDHFLMDEDGEEEGFADGGMVPEDDEDPKKKHMKTMQGIMDSVRMRHMGK